MLTSRCAVAGDESPQLDVQWNHTVYPTQPNETQRPLPVSLASTQVLGADYAPGHAVEAQSSMQKNDNARRHGRHARPGFLEASAREYAAVGSAPVPVRAPNSSSELLVAGRCDAVWGNASRICLKCVACLDCLTKLTPPEVNHACVECEASDAQSMLTSRCAVAEYDVPPIDMQRNQTGRPSSHSGKQQPSPLLVAGTKETRAASSDEARDAVKARPFWRRTALALIEKSARESAVIAKLRQARVVPVLWHGPHPPADRVVALGSQTAAETLDHDADSGLADSMTAASLHELPSPLVQSMRSPSARAEHVDRASTKEGGFRPDLVLLAVVLLALPLLWWYTNTPSTTVFE